MEFLYQYIKNICIFSLVISLVLNIFPESSSKKSFVRAPAQLDDYITSFSGMYPKDDPKVILYVAFQRSYNSNVLPQTVQTIVRDTAKYLGIFEEAPEINKEVTTYKLGSYKNKTTESVKQSLDALGASYVIFGDGNKVISQYPNKNSKVSTKDKVFIFTNGTITMPDLTNYSVKEADVVLSKLGIKHTINASGYIGYQSVSAGTVINSQAERI